MVDREPTATPVIEVEASTPKISRRFFLRGAATFGIIATPTETPLPLIPNSLPKTEEHNLQSKGVPIAIMGVTVTILYQIIERSNRNNIR